ncbi:MAG: hypothetical protein JWQ83_1282 [Lacunisphaera sp.]|nr:hypothetical protein [Lacunisphaera sp.]
MRFVFLTEGSLFLQEDGGAPVEIESQFAQAAIDRATTRGARQAWKNQERGGAGMYSASSVWGRQAGNAADDHPVMRQVARGAAPDELLYTLAMSASSGLFRYNLATRDELRLFHRQDFDACGVSCDPANGQIVVASRGQETLGKLELIDESTRRRDVITAGDGHDSNPCHDANARGIVYFQSSGVGRDEHGNIVALGPAAIHRLDQASGEMQTVLEGDDWDFLQPRTDSAGALYFIRRPYGERDDVPLGQKVKAFFLMPVHLAGAVFGFLDAFSRMFGKQSLRPAGKGPGIPITQSRYATFHDTTVQLGKVLNRKGRIDDDLQLVPKSWELVKRGKSGDETVLANHVVAFDVGPAGEVVYTDGLRVWQAGPAKKKLHEGHIIQSVVIV